MNLKYICRSFLKASATIIGNSSLIVVISLLLAFSTVPSSAQEIAPEQEDIYSVMTPEEPLGSYQEAAEFAELVATGELPPVEQRLPENPPIVVPFDRIGQYGGTLRLPDPLSTSFTQHTRYMNESLFSRSSPDGDYSYANLAERMDVSEDLQTFTIHLRQGVKWSDGVPLTSADFMFHWNDVVRYSPDPSVSVQSLVSGDLYVGGEPITLEAADDFTLIMRTAAPFAEHFARTLAYYATTNHFGPSPMHYLEQFHPKYNNAADPVEAWNEFKTLYNNLINPDRPGIGPWIVSEFTEGERVVMHRNPYYWKIDEEGRQLPYVDEVIATYVGDSEVLTLQLASGSYDFMVGGIPLSAVLFQEQERGGYRLIPNRLMRFVALKLNNVWMSEQDDTPENDRLVELFKNSEFLRALQLGLDNDRFTTAYSGPGLDEYIGTNFGSMIFHKYSDIMGTGDPRVEQMVAERQEWMRYDVDEANSILEQLGLTIGSDGFRQYPDGGRVEITVGSYTDYQPVGEITEVAAQALEENLSIDFTVDTRPYADTVEDFSDGYGVPLAGFAYVGKRFVNDYIHIDYLYQRPITNYMKSDGEQGVAPYDELMEPLEELWAISDEAAMTTDPAARLELSIRAAQIMHENYLDYPLTMGGRDDHFLAHNRVVNIPNGFPHWADERNIRMEQWWINESP